jgi:hypothetical protein
MWITLKTIGLSPINYWVITHKLLGYHPYTDLGYHPFKLAWKPRQSSISGIVTTRASFNLFN